ncbi:hypothetical protein CQ046_02875 [Chryseobacterium sp. MYb7]|uniref:hypothetical protein n=1 Tax=Chryseobacterium sp. MYb7 TaxID=1827290 RepID=UPI000CFE9887|nr:hypothetical protein [Chryseobacterium sp. MYb7]PRB06130.1 hypothetical protein CQ046_02875 [Chryseobacterium sp. MYb7]
MNLQLLLPLLITSLTTIIGWFMLHRFTQRRDLENKKKDLRINYLIEAWKKLEYASNRNINEEEFIEFMEKPIALIQLFGTNTQIKYAEQIANAIKVEGNANLNKILEDLRSDLRNELNIEKTDTKLLMIRYKK